MNIRKDRKYSQREKLFVISLIGLLGSIILGLLTIYGGVFLDELHNPIISIISILFLLAGIITTVGLFICSIIGISKVMYSFYDISILVERSIKDSI